MAILDVDMKGPFDITAPTNSVNGNEYVMKMRGIVGIGKQNGFEYYAYIREGNKLRPMTMKELKESETLKKIVEDIKRHKGESIETFQVHCADNIMIYDRGEKFLRTAPSSDYDKAWQKTYLEDIAKKNGLTPFSREDLKNHENLHEWLDKSSKHKSSKHDGGRRL